jgi:hypothetical protein
LLRCARASCYAKSNSIRNCHCEAVKRRFRNSERFFDSRDAAQALPCGSAALTRVVA